MAQQQQLVWLITGCTSGFGEEMVRQAISRGDLVIATGRDISRLSHLKEEHDAQSHSRQGGLLSLLRLDVTDPQETIDEVVANAIRIHGRIDVLVNNAGYIAFGSWEDLSYDMLKSQFETNVFGAFKVTRAVLPYMHSSSSSSSSHQQSGTLVFISSRSGWYGDPFCGAYAGSKFALEGMVESLSREVSDFGIRTLIIEPGRFRTGFLSSSSSHSEEQGQGQGHGHGHKHGSGSGMVMAPSKTEAYQARYAEFSRGIAQEDGNQPGDVGKGVSVILDIVRGEGVAEGNKGLLPLRIPLGTDCFETVEEKCVDTLKVLKDWESVIKGCEHE